MESDELILPRNVLEVYEDDDLGIGYDDDLMEEDDADLGELDKQGPSRWRRTVRA